MIKLTFMDHNLLNIFFIDYYNLFKTNGLTAHLNQLSNVLAKNKKIQIHYSQLNYDNNSIDGSYGVVDGKLQLEISWSKWVASFGMGVPDYQTKPDDLNYGSIPGTSSPNGFSIKFNF